MEKSRILVWDLPTRVSHWLLAVSFAGAFLTAESEQYRDIHIMLGYTVLGLIAFRLFWGFFGTRYSRFSSFAFGPHKVLEYLKSLLARPPQHYVGHNPAGSWAIYALLALGALAGISGYALYAEIGPEWLDRVHATAGNTMLAVVILHVAGVIVSGFMHRENLVKSMLTGYKRGVAEDGIRSRRGVVGGIVAIAVLVVWAGGFDIFFAATPGSPKDTVAHRQHAGEKDR